MKGGRTSLERKAGLPVMLRRRPRVRSECVDGPRPCPWLSCRHHLGVDVLPSGKVKYPAGQEEWMHGDRSMCSLDLADSGPASLEVVATALGVRLVRIGQLEREAYAHLYELGALHDVVDMTWDRPLMGGAEEED